MNLCYLLLLVCCCGHGGRGCGGHQHSCIMPRKDCMEMREDKRQDCCRKMHRDMDNCGCREKQQEADGCTCMMPGREKRYDSGMQEHPCMDHVPEMNMPSHYPVYPEKCTCRE